MTVEHAPLQEERLQYQLHLQASQVQNVLGQNGMTASVTGAKVNSRAFRYTLKAHFSDGLQRLRGLKNEFKQALGVESVRFLNDAGELQLQVVRPFEPAVPLFDLLALTPALPAATAVLGISADGQPVVHSFSAEAAPNMLISGQEGAGKTVLLRTIAASLAMTCKQAHLQLLAITPVSADRQRLETQDAALRPLNYLPHMLTDVAVRQSEITELLLFLVREMNYRAEHDFAIPRIVVLIDQAATVMEHGGRTVRQAVQTLAQRGAQSGIHLVLSTRRPDAELFGPHLKTNLQAHFVGKVDIARATDTNAQPMEIEATTLLGEGDFLAANGSRGLHFQAAYINNYELHMALSQLYQQRPILLAQPLDTRVKLEQKNTTENTSEEQYSFLDELISID